MQLEASLTAKLGFLFEPHRYKVCYGGRGGGKSQGFAIALILMAIQKNTRILCAREVQKSIKDSVHRLIADQIAELNLGAYFQILETEIRCKTTGSLFLFSGLSTHTVDSLKSMSGIDICWVEEAQSVSKKSWEVLLPTIRVEGSEIWISFNPALETDETYLRFVKNPPDDCIVVKLNYDDNPYFPITLERERINCKKQYPNDYPNIWLGECRPAVDGAIYYDEMIKVNTDNRICNVPYDSKLKVHIVFDLGFRDAMAISLVQVHASEIRVIEYHEFIGKTLSFCSNLLKEKKYNWGQVYLPHDARQTRHQTGQNDAQVMAGYGWEVRTSPAQNISTMIRETKEIFCRVYFDKSKTERLIECLKRYRWDAVHEGKREPIHDEYSHGADCFRYIAQNIKRMTNDEYGEYVPLAQNESPLGLSWG